jgi:hypothetical protein
VAERDPASDIPVETLRAELTRLIHGLFSVMPRDVRIVDSRWLVKSTSGKISREANRRKYEDDIQYGDIRSVAYPGQEDAE